MEDDVRRILSKLYDTSTVERKLKTHLVETKKGYTLCKLIRLYGVEKAEQKFTDKINNDKVKNTLAGFIARYGEEEGTTKYYEKNKKLSVSPESLRRAGKTPEEIESIRNKHRKNSAITLENLVERYGETIGKQKYTEWKLSAVERSVRCPEYWEKRGLSAEEAIVAVGTIQRRDKAFFLNAGWSPQDYENYITKKVQGFSLAGYISRHGKDTGPLLYRYDKQKGSSISWFIERYGPDVGIKKYEDMTRQKCVSSRNSKGQLSFSADLYALLPDDLKQYFYGEPHNDSFFINFPENSYGICACVPDIRIKNIAIEYDGDYWHSREDVRIKDAEKEILLRQKGISVFRVLESKYLTQRDLALTETLRYILENVDINFSILGEKNEDKKNNER